MLGWIITLFNVAAVFLFYSTGHPVWLSLAVLNTLLNFWCLGVMHNYASYARRTKASRLWENLALEGRLDDNAVDRLQSYERGLELRAIPRWLVYCDIVSSFLAIVLLAAGFYFRLG